MSVQAYYEAGNNELAMADADITESGSTNHAVLACAYYLRSITEMLGTKFSEEEDSHAE